MDGDAGQQIGHYDKFSIAQRVFLLVCYVKFAHCYALIREAWGRNYPGVPCMKRSGLFKLSEKFFATGSICNRRRGGSLRRIRIQENLNILSAHIGENHRTFSLIQ